MVDWTADPVYLVSIQQLRRRCRRTRQEDDQGDPPRRQEDDQGDPPRPHPQLLRGGCQPAALEGHAGACPTDEHGRLLHRPPRPRIQHHPQHRLPPPAPRLLKPVLPTLPGAPGPRKSRRLVTKAIAANLSKSTSFYDITSRSYLALIGFLLDYFGCLTQEQAGSYLRSAGADLALAIRLVEHDLYEQLSDPGSGRTKASLDIAVRRAGHPAPDRLLELTTSVFPPHRLEAIKRLLLAAGGTNLTVEGVYLLRRLILQDSSYVHLTLLPQGALVARVLKQALSEGRVTEETSDLGDGYKTTTIKPVGEYISSLRTRQDMDKGVELCSSKSYNLKCGESCEHLQSLRMRILDTLHSLYLDAIAKLPLQDKNGLIRDILVAGHCYGPLEPVANIIVNSIWYNRLRPLPWADCCNAPYDVLDTLSILRVQVRSLEGIMEAVRAMYTELSARDIMKNICRAQCDISQLLWLYDEDTVITTSRSHPLRRAAMAAEHPLPAALALFHKQLSKDISKKKNLQSMIKTTGVLSVGDIDRITDIVDEIFIITPEVQPSLQAQVPQLHNDAYGTLLRKRSEYECRSKYFRSKLLQMLDKYAAQHPWEGNYTLGVICGVEKCGYLFAQGYRVNFLAAGSNHDKNTLFFAEFWVAHKPNESKPDICCPLNPPYTGRCFYSKNSARKIVYPDSTDYFMCDVTAHGISNVDDILDADFVYFDSKRDMDFAKKVNGCYAENSSSHPTVLKTDTKIFGDIRLRDLYPCSSVSEFTMGLSLGELV